jgi:hypothetical protein
VRVDQCVCAIGAVEVPVFLRTFVFDDTPVTRIRAEHDLCCLPCVAAASGNAELDIWPVIQGGCYRVIEVGGPYSL